MAPFLRVDGMVGICAAHVSDDERNGGNGSLRPLIRTWNRSPFIYRHPLRACTLDFGQATEVLFSAESGTTLEGIIIAAITSACCIAIKITAHTAHDLDHLQ